MDAVHIAEEILPALSRRISVTASSDGDGFFEFSAEAIELDERFAGQRLALFVGTTKVMGLTFPASLTSPDRHFGPVRIPVTALRRNIGFAFSIIEEAGGRSLNLLPEQGVGDLFEATRIDTEHEFLHRIQNNHTKFASPDVLMIGAKSYYHRSGSIELQAACLTIMFHRLIWKEPKRIGKEDTSFIRWLVGQSRSLLKTCRTELKTKPPSWSLVRWMVSLATVAGHGALINGDSIIARDCYAIAGSQTNNLKISPVSGLNVINGCFFSGLLAAATGNMEMAGKQLRNAVNGLRAMVHAQDLLANIWVTGDILDAGRTSRQAMIALVRLGLLDHRNEPMIGPAHQLDLKAAKSPVGKLAEAGFCRDAWEKLESMLDRDVT
jgi:hypothetical protein